MDMVSSSAKRKGNLAASTRVIARGIRDPSIFLAKTKRMASFGSLPASSGASVTVPETLAGMPPSFAAGVRTLPPSPNLRSASAMLSATLRAAGVSGGTSASSAFQSLSAAR